MGKRNAAFYLAIFAVMFASAPYLLRLGVMMFENGDPRLVPTVFAFSMLFQLCGVSSAVLTHAMIGDIVEESQLRTGRRSEGLFYAANTLMQKSTSGLGVFAAGLLVAEDFAGRVDGHGNELAVTAPAVAHDITAPRRGWRGTDSRRPGPAAPSAGIWESDSFPAHPGHDRADIGRRALMP